MHLTVNIFARQNGDGQVCIQVDSGNGTVVFRGDSVSVHINRDLPDLSDPKSQVSVYKGNVTLGKGTNHDSLDNLGD